MLGAALPKGNESRGKASSIYLVFRKVKDWCVQGERKNTRGSIFARYTGGQKYMSFRYNATIAKQNITLTPARPKSNIVPATQHTSTFQRNNTDKAAEACITLYKRPILG